MNSSLRKYTKSRISNSFLKFLLKYFAGKIPITIYLIAINVVLFILLSILGLFYKDFVINYIALTPQDFIHGKNFWTLITSMFMHANLAHLFFNMFSLFFIGLFTEKIIGRKRFLWFYLAAGIFAGIFFSVLSAFFGNGEILVRIFGNPSIAGVGASGAIFGLLGILAILTPKARVYLILGPLLAIVLESILQVFLSEGTLLSSLLFLVNFYFLLSIFAIISFNSRLSKIALPVEIPFWVLPIIAILPLVIVGYFVDLPIGNMAHLGGLVAGLAYGIYLRNKYKRKVQMLNRVFR